MGFNDAQDDELDPERKALIASIRKMLLKAMPEGKRKRKMARTVAPLLNLFDTGNLDIIAGRLGRFSITERQVVVRIVAFVGSGYKPLSHYAFIIKHINYAVCTAPVLAAVAPPEEWLDVIAAVPNHVPPSISRNVLRGTASDQERTKGITLAYSLFSRSTGQQVNQADIKYFLNNLEAIGKYREVIQQRGVLDRAHLEELKAAPSTSLAPGVL